MTTAKSRPSPWRRLDRTQLKRYVRAYRKKNRKRLRNYQLRKHFGITLDDYNKQLAKQKGVCAVCRHPETRKGNHGKVKAFAVDHDHHTRKVRGLLCQDCNTALGLLKEDLTRISNLADYIAEYL